MHYVPYWNATGTDQPDDIVPVLEELEEMDKKDPAALQNIVASAMSFSSKWAESSGYCNPKHYELA